MNNPIAKTAPIWLLASFVGASLALAQPAPTPAPPPAPAPEPASQPAAAPADEPAPFLWRVDGPAGTSWLLGTIHLGVGLDELAPVVLERFDAARTVIFEADVRAIDPFGILEMAQLPEGQHLSALLRPEVWDGLRAQFPMLPEAQMARMQPSILEAMLASLTMPTLVPLDLALLTRAAAAGQTLRFLETWQEQVVMMNGIPLEQATADLARWVDERNILIDQLLDLIEAFRYGDLETVEAIVLDPEELARSTRSYEITLFERNDRWLAPVRSAVDEGGAFIAVGLGHLVGERGLIALLRQSGYTVVRSGP